MDSQSSSGNETMCQNSVPDKEPVNGAQNQGPVKQEKNEVMFLWLPNEDLQLVIFWFNTVLVVRETHRHHGDF